MEKKVTTEQVLDLIKRLPESEQHIYICPISTRKYRVTNEWLTGAFAGRSFCGDSFEEATEELIEYLYRHIGHSSLVGKFVSDSGFPDLEKVYEYCKPKEEL